MIYMTEIQKRIRLAKLAERIKNNQKYANEIGVSVNQNAL